MQRVFLCLVVGLGFVACDDAEAPDAGVVLDGPLRPDRGLPDGDVPDGDVGDGDVVDGDAPDEAVDPDDGVPPVDQGVVADEGADEGGAVDMGPSGCTPGATSSAPCRELVGVCARGVATCGADRAWGDCAPPAAEFQADETRCDGRDNDCDGTSDEGFTGVGLPCDTDDADLCAYGLSVCNASGDGTECIEDEPVSEVCNGLDDDCDGTVDEEAPDAPAARRQQGVCAGQVQVCAGGEWAEPDYRAIVGYEVGEQSCDGLDNDCDGRVDAGLFAPAADLQGGVCAGQVKRCGGAMGWLEPEYAGLPGFEGLELSCDGRDNDCDGSVDELIDPPPCALSRGVCAEPAAPAECRGAQGFGGCTYGPDYQAVEQDTCDALDNDCDGVIDEGAPCPIGRRTVRVEPGRFQMGSPADEAGRQADEARHAVVLTHAMLVRVTEVTQGEWNTVMGNNPSARPGADLPVEQIAWLDAVRFANALSRAGGLPPCYQIEGDTARWPDGYDCPGWRLPTEAEWEYLARAGSDGIRWSDEAGVALADAAWFNDNSAALTHPVGQRAANGFGLYDVLGNVNEWVWDLYGPYPAGEVVDPVGPDAGSDRNTRGGAYLSRAPLLRSANRAATPPRTVADDIGLRVLRTAPVAVD